MSPNARSYKVIATGYNDTLQCNTSDTSCELQNLECGQNYTVTVWAEDGTCRGPDSPRVTFQSVPCIPQNITAAVMCGVNSLIVTWNVSSGATGYSAAAVGSQGQLVTTNIEDTTCLLPNLECGEVYYLTVLAMNDECKSAESPVLEIVSAPCSPLHLTALPQCSPLGASASWESSIGAKSYTATFIGMDGDRTSCSTNNTSCSVSELHCGQVYNITATAYDNNCFSLTTNITQISSAPCVPTNAVAKVDCSENYINVTWSPSHGAESYMVTATGKTGDTLYCNTTTNGCSVMNLHCSDNYMISLIAQNKDCSSDVLTVGNLDTVPCIPDNVVVDIECLTNEALVSWQDKNSYYTVVAHDLSDNEFSCSTFTNSCRISGLNCGQEYSFLLTAQNRLCSSSQSNAHKTMTAPCQPQDLTQSLDCEGNIASLSWSASRGAVYYLATLSGNGTTIYFNTTDTNYSSSALTCGQSYNTSVVALDNKCRSISSATTTFDTAPCRPQNLATEFDCNTQIAALLWDKSDGAWLYNITIHSAEEGTFSYSTADNFFNELLYCGQTYSFTVSAVGGTCNSSRSLTPYQTSAPCHPQDLIERLDCESNNASLFWSESGGAVYYLASLSGNGTTVYCNTTDTSCSFPTLTCGQSYNASVVTMDNKCRSVLSATTTFDTAPCQPQDLIENVDCESNNASLSWSASIGAVYYLASLSGNGTTAYCNTTDTSCSFPALTCGQSYNASVVALDNKCRSVSSATTTFDTAPCRPQNLATEFDCNTQIAALLWDKSDGAWLYNITIHSATEGTFSYSTADNFFNELLYCGQTYSFTVSAVGGTCNSSRSLTHYQTSAPCHPQDLIERLDCESNNASLSWSESGGAVYYLASLSGNGTTVYCNTTDTSCSFPALTCGQSYNASVVTMDNKCRSVLSATTTFDTAPCQPQDLIENVDCESNNASLSWSASIGAVYYLASLSGNGTTAYCNTTDTSCSFPALTCGQSYNASVVALDNKCRSVSSATTTFDTVPCVPQNTKVFTDCKNNSATFLWERSEALSYLAIVHEDDNYVHLCDTENTECLVYNLNCGSTYSFSVLATDLKCNSSFSSPVLAGVVPCPPGQVETSIYHRNVKPQEVEITWNGSHCGEEYMATVQGEIGNDEESSFILHSYWTSYMDFYIPVPCSSSYNVTVTARNLAGVSDPSEPIKGCTAPCSPRVNELEMANGNMLLSWYQSTNTEEYRVLDIADNSTVCRTSALSCEIPFRNSTMYLIAVNTAGESEPVFFSWSI
ncbi:fibronectin type III domain-containing protein 7-like [Pelobates fuscus]|uniref:fibronectin type III domain-containing protein 7-like n=1 Tax=Pelobates fuscus TaxID=191477 RepID=UPI002FE4347F